MLNGKYVCNKYVITYITLSSFDTLNEDVLKYMTMIGRIDIRMKIGLYIIIR